MTKQMTIVKTSYLSYSVFDIFQKVAFYHKLDTKEVNLQTLSLMCPGVVGWCEGAVYLTSPGCPTDTGLQLGKACYPCSG